MVCNIKDCLLVCFLSFYIAQFPKVDVFLSSGEAVGDT
jgi:hypothetical protein